MIVCDLIMFVVICESVMCLLVCGSRLFVVCEYGY